MFVIRTRSAGEYLAEDADLDMATGFATLSVARMLERWQGAATTLELVTRGPAQPGLCKAPPPSPTIVVGGVVAVIPCSAEAEQRLRSIPGWSAHDA